MLCGGLFRHVKFHLRLLWFFAPLDTEVVADIDAETPIVGVSAAGSYRRALVDRKIGLHRPQHIPCTDCYLQSPVKHVVAQTQI